MPHFRPRWKLGSSKLGGNQAEALAALNKRIKLQVNGASQELDVPPNMLLVELLRQRLGLTGAHVGCDTCQCGACTVHLDGRAVKSCALFAVQADGRSLRTIEGIGAPGALHPMQEAFRDCHALQCGFCTPGMIMRAIELVERADRLDERAVRQGLEGNICRCTGYHNIVKAVLQGRDAMEADSVAAD